MSIEIKDVVALTGAPGLHQVLKADDRAIVIESLDDRKKRQLIKGNMMISKLLDISIYTEEESEPLVNILKTMREKYGSELPITKKSSKDELMAFLGEILPDFDKERVYPSNVKKLISWYKILDAFEVSLEVADEEEEEGEGASSDDAADEAGDEATEAPKEEKE